MEIAAVLILIIVKYFLLTFLAIVAAVYIFLVLAVNDDKRWFHNFSQSAHKTSLDTLKTNSVQHSRQAQNPTCILPFDCITITNENPNKVLHLKSKYQGVLHVKAAVDTLEFSLKEHKIIYANLVAKANAKDKIELRIDSASGDTAYLNKIMPAVKRHLSYLRFEIHKQPDCIMATWWTFPITID